MPRRDLLETAMQVMQLRGFMEKLRTYRDEVEGRQADRDEKVRARRERDELISSLEARTGPMVEETLPRAYEPPSPPDALRFGDLLEQASGEPVESPRVTMGIQEKADRPFSPIGPSTVAKLALGLGKQAPLVMEQLERQNRFPVSAGTYDSRRLQDTLNDLPKDLTAGSFRDVKLTPQGPTIDFTQPKSGDQFRTKANLDLGGDPVQRIANLQQSEVKLMDDNQVRDAEQEAIASVQRDEQLLAGVDSLGRPVSVSESDRRALRVGQIAKAARAQELHKEAVKRGIYGQEQPLFPQFSVPRQTIDELRDTFMQQRGRKPTEQEMMALIADRLFPAAKKKF